MSTATTTSSSERPAVHAPARSLTHHKGVRVMLYPILWLFASSFKSRAEIWTNISALIPQEFTLVNYVNGWKGFGGITFTTFYINSFFYAGVATLLTVMASANQTARPPG